MRVDAQTAHNRGEPSLGTAHVRRRRSEPPHKGFLHDVLRVAFVVNEAQRGFPQPRPVALHRADVHMTEVTVLRNQAHEKEPLFARLREPRRTYVQYAGTSIPAASAGSETGVPRTTCSGIRPAQK